MVDRISKEKRSWNMSRIKGNNTGLEMRLRKFLYGRGLRYRVKNHIYGKPDIVFNTKKAAIFVNGCFWHQHKNCKLSYMPKSNTLFWKEKLEGNKRRDRDVYKKLTGDGWNVIYVWECELEEDPEKCAGRVINMLS